jgi:hypothetical protein
VTAILAMSLTGCFQAKAARDLRGEYASQAYLQSVEAAHATRSLATELLDHDAPETVRQRLEGELLTALEAARTDDAGTLLDDPEAVQKRTIRAVLWYEGERRGLDDWYTTQLQKIDDLGKVIESTGEATLRTNRMANAELTVSEEALRSFAKTKLPDLVGDAVKARLATRDAGQVVEKPDAEPVAAPTH